VISGAKPPRPPERPPRILVVDDDRRVLELLDLALTAQGFQVLTALDGDEALRQALEERPDLVVLDVRLPKKGGLDVCEALRRDPEDGTVPIILVSASGETETRLQGFARGADDYLAKPFSPKELIARVKRLLARSAEARESRRRAVQLERDLGRAQDDVRRANVDLRREQRMRELAYELGRELNSTLDLDQVAARFLLAAQSRLGSGMVALLAPGSECSLVPLAVRGDGFERLDGIDVRHGGELEGLLCGLARPVLRRDLERFPELEAEVRPLTARGVALIAPLRGPRGAVGLLLADERMDGADFDPSQIEVLGGLCEIAAAALSNAGRARDQLDRALEFHGGRPLSGRARALRAEAAALTDRAARATRLPPRSRSLLSHAIRLGAWGLGEQGRRALHTLGSDDPTGRMAELIRMLEGAIAGGGAPDESFPDQRRAILLLGVALRYADERIAGLDVEPSLEVAAARAGEALDPATRHALNLALLEFRASAEPGEPHAAIARAPRAPAPPAGGPTKPA
jgi:DNA-binding response OmpR family regulator